MSFPTVDNAALTAVTPNLSVGQIADPNLRLAAFQYLYGFLSTIVSTLNSMTAGSSGADNLASATVIGVTGNTVRAQITDLMAKIQALQDGVVPSGTITSAMIADLAIITAKLNDLAVTTPKIADNAVTFAKLSLERQVASIGGQVYVYKNMGGF